MELNKIITPAKVYIDQHLNEKELVSCLHDIDKQLKQLKNKTSCNIYNVPEKYITIARKILQNAGYNVVECGCDNKFSENSCWMMKVEISFLQGIK